MPAVDMKQNVKITLSALMAALATIMVLAAYFPYVTYAAPALGGCVVMLVLIEIDARWAFGAFLVSSVLSLLFAEREAGILYVCFFGFYPIVKALFEKLRSRVLEWVLKLLTFNAAMLLVYGLLSLVIGLGVEEFGVLGKYGAWIFLAAGNVVFVLYDFALIRVASLYIYRIHPKIRRIL